MDKDNNIVLYLHLKTYQKSSYNGIFAHNKMKITKDIIFLKENSFVFRNGDEIKKYQNHTTHLYNEEIICWAKLSNNIFKLINPISSKLYQPTIKNINKIKNKLWYIINSYPNKKDKDKNYKDENEDYYLCEGDIIKIGIELFILRKIYIQNKNKEEDKNEGNIYDIHSFNYNNKSIIFDICTEPKVLDSKNFCNHIINDLKQGKNSPKFQEIQKWIYKSVIEINKNNNKKVKGYKFNLYECKECNKIYPIRFKLPGNDEIIELVHIEIPKNKNYMILESVEQIKEDKEEDNLYNILKAIYIIELTGEDEEITIGRIDKNDLILARDITVSKEHAIIKYYKKNKKFILKDKNSYTGTMVLIKNNFISLSDKKEIYLQSGRTYITAKIMDKKEYERKEKEEKLRKKEEEDNKEKLANNINEKDLISEQKFVDLYGD